MGSEGRGSKHDGALLPEPLRRVWRNGKTPIAKPPQSFASRWVDQAEEGPPASLAMGGEGNSDVRSGRLFAIQPARRRMVAYDATGRELAVAANLSAQ